MFDTTTAKSAAEAYKMHEANITILLAGFIDKKREHAELAAKQPTNWGYVGDIGSTERLLRQAIEAVNVNWTGT